VPLMLGLRQFQGEAVSSFFGRHMNMLNIYEMEECDELALLEE
jgi:hypothetical protein